jgi:hypothetical protein
VQNDEGNFGNIVRTIETALDQHCSTICKQDVIENIKMLLPADSLAYQALPVAN